MEDDEDYKEEKEEVVDRVTFLFIADVLTETPYSK